MNPAAPVVVVTEAIDPTAMDRLIERFDVRIPATVDASSLLPAVAGAAAIIVRSSPLPATVIAAAPGLRVIGRHGVGVENIDVVAATTRGIPVVNTPGANAVSVAEFVVMVTLESLRRPAKLVAAFQRGELGDGSLPGAIGRRGLLGRDVAGSRIGIVGLGAVGRRVASAFTALGADVVHFDPAVGDGDRSTALPLNELLASSDVVTLHAPLTPETRNLLSADALAMLRPGAVVINTARAELVDTDAMVAALDREHVERYVVDVYAPEPPPLGHPLLHHPRVLATPHMAAMTTDAMSATSRAVVDNVMAVLDGKRAAATVNPEVYGGPPGQRTTSAPTESSP